MANVYNNFRNEVMYITTCVYAKNYMSITNNNE